MCQCATQRTRGFKTKGRLSKLMAQKRALRRKREARQANNCYTRITSNFGGMARTEYRNGREYLVAPLTLIVPGTLAGSKGPLYYPPDELQQAAPAWQNIPITVNHPPNGQSFRDGGHPAIGFVDRPRMSGTKLVSEGWFDAEITARVDKRVYKALRDGTKLELSTGLHTDNYPAPDGSIDYKGRAYSHVARNHRPDHLAVLPDALGACAIADGCGVFNSNEENWYTWAMRGLDPDQPVVTNAADDLPLIPSINAFGSSGSDNFKDLLETAERKLRNLRSVGDPAIIAAAEAALKASKKARGKKESVETHAQARELNHLAGELIDQAEKASRASGNLMLAGKYKGSYHAHSALGSAHGRRSTSLKQAAGSADGGNCGIGSGGFQPGNTCARNSSELLIPPVINYDDGLSPLTRAVPYSVPRDALPPPDSMNRIIAANGIGLQPQARQADDDLLIPPRTW